MRSTAKSIQLLPLLTSGAADRFGFTEEEIAIMAASHSGEPIHTVHVESILNKIGLDKSYLHCGIHPPFDKTVQQELAGRTPDVLQNNCSGKHAGMLALALHLNAPTTNYDAPENPVQLAIGRAVAQFSDVPLEDMAIAVCKSFRAQRVA